MKLACKVRTVLGSPVSSRQSWDYKQNFVPVSCRHRSEILRVTWSAVSASETDWGVNRKSCRTLSITLKSFHHKIPNHFQLLFTGNRMRLLKFVKLHVQP